MAKVFNRPSEKAKRQRLRSEMPRAENLLWSKLRGKQLAGLRFRRQHGIGPYVVDFYCPEVRLAVEVDGDSHFGDGAEKRDQRRQAYVESFGILFMRCTNGDVYKNIEGVLEEIERVGTARLQEKTPLNPPLVKGGSCKKATQR